MADPLWAELAGLALATGFLVFAMAKRSKPSGGGALGHPLRRRIWALLRRRPGLRLEGLWKSMGVSRGTTQYHLFVLARLGAVHLARQAGTTRYFPAGADHHDTDSVSVLLRGRILELVALLLDHPGWCQQEFTRALGIRRKTFREYADALARQDLVAEQRDQFRKRYFPTARLERILPMLQRGGEDSHVGLDAAPDRPGGHKP